MRAGHLPGEAAVRSLGDPGAEGLDPYVGQRFAQALGVTIERVDALHRPAAQRVLVAHVDRATERKVVAAAPRPGALPAIGDAVEPRALQLLGRRAVAHCSSGTPSIGVDASA